MRRDVSVFLTPSSCTKCPCPQLKRCSVRETTVSQPSKRYLWMMDDSVTVVDSNSLDVCLKSDHRLSHAHFTYLKIAGPLTISCNNQWLKAVDECGRALIEVFVDD